MKKNIFKYSILFIAPALLMSTIAIAGASWKDSIKDDSAEVDQRLYTIEFFNNSVQYCDPYEGLELNSGFEMPIISEEGFSGWGTTSSNNSGQAYLGYHKLSDFFKDIDNTRTLKLYAKYNVPTINQVTYTVTSLPSWLNDNDCVTFAWVWSTNDAGSWHYLNYTSASSATFTADEELTGFMLVRCYKGTTIPNYSVTGNNVGRVYNKTDDINCSSGVYSYSASSWQEYNP